MKSETLRRDRLRVDEKCSRFVDEYTACQIEHGHCEKSRKGDILFIADWCGENAGGWTYCESEASKH